MGYTRVPDSMTGSDVGIPATHRSSVSIALGQLRRLVSVCCLLLVGSLLVQGAVWATATFGDVRYTTLEPSAAAAPLVVDEAAPVGDDQADDPAPAMVDPLGERVVISPEPQPADPNTVLTATDRVLELTATLAGACGRLATAALVPLVLLGVLLAAGSATDGVDRTVSAFAWSTITLFLVFPIAANFGMPWNDGGLWEYQRLVGTLDGPPFSSLEMYLQYGVVPITTLFTVLIARSRFAGGVAAGLIRGEDLRLDPTLERETAGIKPGSLHGSRNARVMHAVTGPEGGPMDAPPVPAPPGIAMSGAGTAGGAMVSGLATPPGVAGVVGPSEALPPTGTEGARNPEHGGGPMHTSSGEAPRRLI